MINDLMALVVAAMISVPGATVTEPEPTAVPVFAHHEVQEVSTTQEFRGVWVTTVINLDFPSRPGLSNAEIKREIDYIVNHSRSLGLNAIILQVRPAGDAIYPSALFPWSKYLTGQQGLAPADGFDPLAYWLERTHAAGMELHAWINPYRVTHSTSRITDVNLLHPSNPARLRPDLVVQHPVNTALYLDPGFPDAQQLIIDGVIELLRNYPTLNGIHFDDYFYPHRDFNDSASFALYGAGFANRHEWRVHNVNQMVYGVRQAINEINPNVRFGISPTGIWANQGSHPLGSQTRGFQHYLYISADSRRWVQEGWIDYIIPQIYWHIGFDIADYEILLAWWEDLVRGTDVGLHIGHAAWREHEGQANFGGEMQRQLEMNAQSDVVTGSVFFRWAHLRGPVGDTVSEWYGGRPQQIVREDLQRTRTPVLAMDQLNVAFPTGDATVNLSATGHNMWGSSIPHLPLYMNGQPVANRTPEGFFSVFAPLQDGQNTFEFTQPGQPSVVRRVNRTAPVPAPPSAPAPVPVSREYSRSEPHYATVTADVAWLFPGPTITGGANQLLERGQTDRIIASARDGAWLRLSNGYWIEASNVDRHRADTITENIMTSGSFVLGRDRSYENTHMNIIVWNIDGDYFPAARAEYEDGKLTVYFGMQSIPMETMQFQHVQDSIFSNVESGVTSEGISYMTFTTQDDIRINGFDIRPVREINGNSLQLTIMRPRQLYPHWRTPFNGFTFVIDPGHGGTDYGALGPMGRLLAEKHIALANSKLLAQRLEELGAEVILLRTDNDTDVSLRERVVASRNARPDMFISMHANSVAETTDATGIRGFTVWHRNPSSYTAARTMLNHLHYVNPGTNRWSNPNQANFYVCRPTWAPHILLETSFMSNIDDFAWMITPEYQARLADETVGALIGYYIN